MDLLEEEKKIQDQSGPVEESKPKHYTIGVRHRYIPLEKKHQCYRHEVTGTGHLVLYRINRSQIAIDIRKKSWIVYSDYWDFMEQVEKLKAKQQAE
jgi:hypothetical protein